MNAHREAAIGGFDEAFYLDEYPDVCEAVGQGLFASGLEHWLVHGRREGRAGSDAEVPPESRFPAPVPPRALRARVHGTPDRASFETVGKIVADDLAATARRYVELDRDSSVLDFGCGCGRVLAYFRRLNRARLFGTDIDTEAIAWCRENLEALADFSVNASWPPLAYRTEAFDLVYAVSVFTHLPLDMQWAWLEELQRVARPAACLLLTTHGEQHLPALTRDERDAFERDGFLYLVREPIDGLPAFYQNAFQTHAFIRSQWSRWFEIEDVIERGIGNHQDLVVCRKRRATA
jgi:SAM-dependent methyltransferase